MWRDARFDSVGRRIFLDAVDGRYTPIFDLLQWNPPTAGRVHFSDDFMRENWNKTFRLFAIKLGFDPSKF